MSRSFNAQSVPISIRRSTASKARVSQPYAARTAAFVVSVLFAALLPPARAQSISLGQAQNFAILGGSTVTNTGATLIAGNVG